MAQSITQKVLKNNTFYTDQYLKDSINLTKSITVVNEKEARLYNEYVQLKYPDHAIDLSNKETWRYYKHLSAQPHPVDLPVTLTSIDNGDTITLTPSSLLLHRITHRELLKYDLLYDELVKRYPEQELYIKTVIATSPKQSISTIINSPDFTIVSYNDRLIEENEGDIVDHLQHRINNYKVNKLIQHYAVVDNLFIASLYHTLYHFIFTSLLAIRLSNAKTLKAHSYHILNYLASHHYLDIHYNSLSRKQALFLYRNLLYLNNHSGQDNIFRLLIDRLFTERNITVVNYTYSQENNTDTQDYMKYRFKQKLLNNANFVYSYNDFELQDIIDKEIPLVQSNEKELYFNQSQTDSAFKNMLYSTLLTKDIESIVVDNTDTVEHKLIPTLVDYWVYLLKTNQMRFLVTVLDPVTNKELRLTTQDLFKLYTLALYHKHKQTPTVFPSYFIQRVYKPTLPSTKELLSKFYKKLHYHPQIVDQIRQSVPKYTQVITSYQFEQFITSIYKVNIGLWLHNTNLDDRDDIGQFNNLVENLHHSQVYHTNDETPQEFLNRINMTHLTSYLETSTDDLLYAILNNLFDNRLGFLSKYKAIQSSMIEVFKKFNSYTVQLINNYTQPTTLIVGEYAPTPTVSKDEENTLTFADIVLPNYEAYLQVTEKQSFTMDLTITASDIQQTFVTADVVPDIDVGHTQDNSVEVYFNTVTVNGLDQQDWIVSESSDEDLKFLAFNN